MTDGFQPGRRPRKLTYDDTTHFPGLYVLAAGLTFDEWEAINTATELVAAFAARLQEWNWLDDDGQPVPPTREGVGSVDAAMVRTIANDWLIQCTGVLPRPLVRAVSSNGALEASIPME